MPVIPPLVAREVKPETGRVISTRVPPELAAQLDEVAKATGHKLSAVVRYLVMAGLKQHEDERRLPQRPNDDDTRKR